MRSRVLGTEELERKFMALDDAVREENLVMATQAGSMVVLNAAKENVQKQGLVRTHNLGRSLTQETAEQSPSRVVQVVGTNLEYGPIHEFGGTIRAKNGKYLAIPLNKAARAAGSPRNYPGGLRLVRGSNGNLVLIDTGSVAQYVLKQSVDIPAKPYLRPAFDENQGEAQDEMGRALRMLIVKVAGE